ncbi:ABC transporter ATP-binding protein [uncultured Pontibacter sp.]|uniref:ABC transporter ATP-binding protein n=1 Tax=uncultured Pontibacter sp. TaxID=453356 RepID=UPI0026351E51|nr:ABC transporter ATP-binding protein [uncultured Pontibacter sp.]
MSNTVIKVENLSKQYRLGELGTGTISHDLNRWWHKVRGKEDPYLKIGETNDRSTKGNSEYVWALRDINFEVKQGEVLGIIGKNGAGKSTLLKLLSRVTSPTTGSIKAKGRIASLLEVGTGFHEELTGRENIFLNGAILGMTKAEIRSKFDEIVAFSGTERYIDTPVKRYSSGMRVRLAFAVAAHLEPEILIVDEVLAVGDAEFQKKAIGKMQSISMGEGRTVLFVSHSMDAVKKICSKGILLKNGLVHLESHIDNIIAEYYEGLRVSHCVQYVPDIYKPSIKRIELNDDLLDQAILELNFEYVSPFKINPPVIGFVLYNAFNVPVFGSNPRFHSEGYHVTSSTEGKVNVKVENLELHSGLYKISAWLGDSYTDYDSKIEAIVFEYVSSQKYMSKPEPLHIGSIDKRAIWKHL